MLYIPKCRISFKPFAKSASCVEQTIFRRIAMHAGDFTKSQRSVLVKMTNLWLRHRGGGWFAPTNEALRKALGLSLRSVQAAMCMFRDLGIFVALSGGRGRGDHVRYAVDLYAMQAILAPDVRIKCAGEWVDLDGEIKGAKMPSPYREKINLITPVWVNLSRSINWHTLGQALRRCQMAQRAWFRRDPATIHQLPSKLTNAGLAVECAA